MYIVSDGKKVPKSGIAEFYKSTKTRGAKMVSLSYGVFLAVLGLYCIFMILRILWQAYRTKA